MESFEASERALCARISLIECNCRLSIASFCFARGKTYFDALFYFVFSTVRQEDEKRQQQQNKRRTWILYRIKVNWALLLLRKLQNFLLFLFICSRRKLEPSPLPLFIAWISFKFAFSCAAAIAYKWQRVDCLPHQRQIKLALILPLAPKHCLKTFMYFRVYSQFYL